jgi:spore maturation protein CgeB
MNLVFIGLTITSSWGNGHATTYRGLMRELVKRGHSVLFLERDVPWYRENRDLPRPPYGRTELYSDLADLAKRFVREVRDADFVMVGSYVPEGVAVGDWVIQTAGGMTGFYDIDTPVTLAKLERGDYEYLAPHLIPRYSLYLSFTGGPTLTRLEQEWKSPCARPLYCAVDPELYYPDPPGPGESMYDLGYMGTYSADRQPPLDSLLLEPARRMPDRRFTVAGPQYPADIDWPENVMRIEHLPPVEHRGFYNRQHWTLNITRADMVRAGWSPSVRLFEAAACGTPIISDFWPGLTELFLEDREIILSRSPEDTVHALRNIPDAERRAIGEQARQKVLSAHTASNRAAELESYLHESLN